MKILVRSLPLTSGNYGGLFQSIALQKKLESFGHDVTLDTPTKFLFSWKTIPRLAKAYLLRNVDATLTPNVRNHVLGKYSAFAERELKILDLSPDGWARKVFKRNKYDAYVVGSDQVWRTAYADVLHNVFADIKAGNPKIAYAASFGIDNLGEFSETTKDRFAELIREFSWVSVREDNAVALCRENFKIEADWVLDPTLLWDADFYNSMATRALKEIGNNEKYLLALFLDPNPKDRVALENWAAFQGLTLRYFYPPKLLSPDQYKKSKSSTVLPDPGDWLAAIRDSEMVVTDSYHGTVFSIIYRRPFFTLGNWGRGLSRFESLLRGFGLEHQLFDSLEKIPTRVMPDIEWDLVDFSIKENQNKSEALLRNALNQLESNQGTP